MRSAAGNSNVATDAIGTTAHAAIHRRSNRTMVFGPASDRLSLNQAVLWFKTRIQTATRTRPGTGRPMSAARPTHAAGLATPVGAAVGGEPSRRGAKAGTAPSSDTRSPSEHARFCFSPPHSLDAGPGCQWFTAPPSRKPMGMARSGGRAGISRLFWRMEGWQC